MRFGATPRSASRSPPGRPRVTSRTPCGSPPAPVTSLAPAVIRDPDHAARIAAHRARRDPGWTTVETGTALVGALRSVRGSALVDSLGSWIAEHDGFAADIPGLCTALTE